MKKLLVIFPFIGIVIFFLLYIYAAYLYPGGSTVNPKHPGFDWFHNYWCDLMNTLAKNGVTNPARSVAQVALVLLAISLGTLFYLFPKYFPSMRTKGAKWEKIVAFAGLSAVLITMFISTDFHDVVIGLGGFLGLLAFLGILVVFKRHNMRIYMFWGWISVFLLVINVIMFFTRWGEYYLPFAQKVAFFIVLSWFGFISWFMVKKAQQ